MQSNGVKLGTRDQLGLALCMAARVNDLKACRELIAQGADIEWSADGQLPPLSSAALHGKVEAAGLLIDAGANVNAADKCDRRALSYALDSEKRFELAQMLLAAGTDPNFRPQWGGVPLSMACGRDDVPLITLLVQHGADPNALSTDLLTIFQSTVFWNRPISVRALAELCVIDMEQLTQEGQTLMDLADTNEEMQTLLRALQADWAVRKSIGPVVAKSPVPARRSASLDPI